MERVIQAHAMVENQLRHSYAASNSIPCYVDAEEVSNLIYFPCSDYRKNISGQVIGVDGFTETLHPRK